MKRLISFLACLLIGYLIIEEIDLLKTPVHEPVTTPQVTITPTPTTYMPLFAAHQKIGKLAFGLDWYKNTAVDTIYWGAVNEKNELIAYYFAGVHAANDFIKIGESQATFSTTFRNYLVEDIPIKDGKLSVPLKLVNGKQPAQIYLKNGYYYLVFFDAYTEGTPIHSALLIAEKMAKHLSKAALLDVDNAALKKAGYELIQLTRREFGLPVFTQNPALEQVATIHAADMSEHRYVASINSKKQSLQLRLKQEGVLRSLYTEHVDDASDFLFFWYEEQLQNKVYRGNLINGDLRELGLAFQISEERGVSSLIMTSP